MRRARTPRAALLALALACLTHVAAGAGVFELQILEFSNERAARGSGGCCGGGGPRAPCSAPCRTKFSLCLKEYQSSAAPGACSFGRAASPVLGVDSFTLTEPLYTLALNFSFRWTRSFTMILQAYDDYQYPDPGEGLIEEAWWSGIVEPGAEWHVLRHAGAAAALTYRVRVTCQSNYFTATCTSFCRPRDDKFGHYTCSSQGDKRCMRGWQGDNCELPVCKEGCDPIHGRCDKPGECLCRPGWRGDLCAQCQPYPGCKHGYCNGSSWDCFCETNWGGILCDQDLNYCGTHEPCQHGGTCENTAPDQYLCTCAEGFSGTDCERVDNPCAPQPCAHGACSLDAIAPGYTCACERGWGGALCDQDLDDCAPAPCRHGTCRDLLDAFACECEPGWNGAICDSDIDECAISSPCVNAVTCHNTAGAYTCTCLAGWTGRDCDVNVDDCTGQCLNGATCIDLVDDFHCACAAGYAGRECERDVDDCASRPCRNGGECVDLRDAYRCICPVGFSGTDCELTSCVGRYCPDDRDHCADAPCGNGATCYTAQSDYYCHCAPGWSGKNCTLHAHRESTPTPHCATLPCRNNSTCVNGADTDKFTCICADGWTGPTCDNRLTEIVQQRCGDALCANGGTCVKEAVGWRCVCATGWAGVTCNTPLSCACAPTGDCVPRPSSSGWACTCHEGWAGPRCDLPLEPCTSSPCRNGGRCSGGVGWWACECPPGWTGPDCARPAPCSPTCSAPARCSLAPRPRCVCPAASSMSPAQPGPHATRCLDAIAGLGADGVEVLGDSLEGGALSVESDAGAGSSCTDGGMWWWGCNVCWCAGGATSCTRLWCGLPDCLAPAALPCRTDEVCVPAAPALCLRGPCVAPGECRRVAGRRVEGPTLPAPPTCLPGTSGRTPPACARASLQLARERLTPGAHVERACAALRRALAASLAIGPRAVAQQPLALLCDLAPDDDDALELALWAADDEAEDATAIATTLAAAVHALSDLVARRRLASHALLGAALRLRVQHGEPVTSGAGAWPAIGGTLVAVLIAAAGTVAFLIYRRRRRANERSRRCDEEKSNNLQNEENLRRYANPLRDEPMALAARRPADELRAHSLYKAQNADARNNTPAPRDKELTKRAPPPALATHAAPERLTVLV